MREVKGQRRKESSRGWRQIDLSLPNHPTPLQQHPLSPPLPPLSLSLSPAQYEATREAGRKSPQGNIAVYHEVAGYLDPEQGVALKPMNLPHASTVTGPPVELLCISHKTDDNNVLFHRSREMIPSPLHAFCLTKMGVKQDYEQKDVT